MEINKKKLLILGSMLPLGFVVGMAFQMAFQRDLNTKRGELEKYHVDSFSTLDSLKKDTLIVKNGELYTDTLINYFSKSKKDIEFRVFDFSGGVFGLLSVKNKGISIYKSLEEGVLSKEIIKKNNETRLYHIVEDLIGKNFKITKFELHMSKPETTPNLLDTPVNIGSNYINFPVNETYIRDTEKGNKVLDDEKKEVDRYLKKIKEHKISNGTWKD